MGNAQSVGQHGQHHNRLSKPKTNTNSPALVDSPTSVTSRFGYLSSRERQQIKAQLLSPVDTEFGGHRDSTDGDEGLGELASNVQRRLSNLSRTNSLSCFGGGRDSATKLANLPNSKLSLVSSSQVDLNTAIRILEEVKRNASPEDLVALDQALRPYQPCPSPRPSPVPEQGLSRRTSMVNRSSSSLIRRRSLVATPGVATRNSPVEGNRRTWNSWRTLHADPRDEAKWRYDMMGNSPLTRLAALDLAEDGRDSPTPRAQTPGEMDYSHLGSLKLGSLRIANGAPSPAPSAKISRRRSNPNFSQDEDYFTASETCESPIMMKTTKRRNHVRSKSAVQPPAPPLHRRFRLSDQVRRTETNSRCDSPLKMEAPNIPNPDEAELSPVRRLRVMNKSADTLALALDYQSGIPTSPFATSHPGRADDHDEGFASEDGKTFRDEAFRILDGTIFGDSITTLESKKAESHAIPRKDITSNKSKLQKTSKRPPPKKIDSGYSSGGSFKAVHHEALREGIVPTLSTKPSIATNIHASGNGSDDDDTASLYTFEQMLRLPIAQKPLPAVPTEQDLNPRPASLHIPDISDKGSARLSAPEPISRILEASSIIHSSPKTPVSIVSQFSVDSKASMQRRLQKRRPSFQELPVVQSCDPVSEGTIPSIPDNVRSKFVRRLSETPGMDCLTRTYASKDHVNDEESPVDSSVAVNIEFPSPSASPEQRVRHHKRSVTERPPTPPPHGVRRSLSFFRRKSTAEQRPKESSGEDENAALNVVDLGTIATSLGQSPYDVAMATVPTKSVTSPTHPHQLGNALPRAKSMVNMDAQTAAAFARTRSKDRALLRPEIPARPRSYHDRNIDAGEGVAYRRRPHTLYADVPPLPSMEVKQPTELHVPTPDLHVEQQISIENASGPNFRARSTGRGPVVSQLIDKYDKSGQPMAKSPQGWESHARLWNQRRKSIGAGLRQRAQESQSRSYTMGARATSEPPEDAMMVDRYSGGLGYGYEGRGYGVGGSAGTRQLHSYASRKSMHFSSHYGVDLSDVPVFVQRA